MKLLFIQAGGTIDKDYPRTKGYAFEINEPAVKRILERINPDFDYVVVTLIKKDSNDINDSDRKMIHDYCLKSKYDKIIITHGTDTMIQTTKSLSKIKDKTIILTGSFIPEKFKDTDAEFNIGTAVGAIGFLRPGIYIAMNGRVFEWDKCKNVNGKYSQK